MTPYDQLFRALGADAEWDRETNTVKGVKNETVVILKGSSFKAFINDEAFTLDHTPFNDAGHINGVLYVNLRFVCEAFGATVDFDKPTLTVNIHLDE